MRTRQRDRRTEVIENICVVVILIAVALLVAWFIVHHGGSQGAAGPF